MSLVATNIARPPMLAPLDLSLAPGTVTGLVGPNGAGKTTLLRTLGGLGAGPGAGGISASGQVTVGGVTLATLPALARVRRLAWLPADRDVAWPMRADALVQLGLGPGAAHDDAAVAAALQATDAVEFAARRVDTLSTGERARVLLARAIVAAPDWLLLDEPVANLDPGHRIDVMTLLQAQAARGAGVVVALHDLELARRWCDRLLLLDKGMMVADGLPAAVLTAGRLADVFHIRQTAAGWDKA